MTNIDILKKIIFEELELLEAPITSPTPTTKPDTRPAQPVTPDKPDRGPNPLKPSKPGISPKPKALTHDVKAFINVRKEKITEKIDVEDYPDYFSDDKRSMIEDEKDYVEKIFPDLGSAADRYLEMITSESYKKNIDRIAYYLNMSVNKVQSKFPDLPTMTTMVFGALSYITNIEKSKKSELEKMAIEVVLELEENKFIKQLVENGELIIDAKLGNADLTGVITEDKLDEEMSNGCTVAENLNTQINKIVEGAGEGKLKRSLANYMTQGDAINKLFLFNQASEKLNQIDPKLVNKYGILSAITQILYYAMPNMSITSDIASQASVGSEQVIPTGDNYTIKARGATFPYLIHEIVKGIGDYLSMDVASQEELDTETMSDEIKQIMAGPGLEMRLRKLIPTDKIKYLPMIKKLFYKLPVDDIKNVLLGGGKSSNIIKDLIKQSEQLMSDNED